MFIFLTERRIPRFLAHPADEEFAVIGGKGGEGVLNVGTRPIGKQPIPWHLDRDRLARDNARTSESVDVLTVLERFRVLTEPISVPHDHSPNRLRFARSNTQAITLYLVQLRYKQPLVGIDRYNSISTAAIKELQQSMLLSLFAAVQHWY